MTPMLPPRLMTGIGTSALKIATNSAEAQAYFSQGRRCCIVFGSSRPIAPSKKRRGAILALHHVLGNLHAVSHAGLALAAQGTYRVISYDYDVMQGMYEIGVRVVLRARRSDVLA